MKDEAGMNRLKSLVSLYGDVKLHPVTLVVSTGRCGTTFLQTLFSESYGNYGLFLHEHLSVHEAKPAIFFRCYENREQEEMLEQDSIFDELCWILESAKSRPVCEFGHYLISVVPVLFKIAPTALRVLMVHRHPVEVSASFTIKGHYTQNKSPVWALTPHHQRVFFPDFTNNWETLSAYEKNLYLWLETNSYGIELPEKLPGLIYKKVGSNDVFKRPEVRREIAAFCGLPPDQLLPGIKKVNRAINFEREMRPVKEEWKTTDRYPSLVSVAQSLGYDCSFAILEEKMAAYQFSSGWAPRIRKWTFYWKIRRWISHLRERWFHSARQ